MTDPKSAADAAPPESAPTLRRRRWRWWIGVPLSLLVLLVVTAAGTARWALYTEGGGAWVLSRVPGLSVSEPRGTLLGGEWSARRLEWRSTTGQVVQVDDPAWRGLAWRITPYEGALVGVHLNALSARRVAMQSPPSQKPSEPLRAPATLRIPADVDVAAVQLDELVLDASPGTPAIRTIRGRLHAGADRGATHIVQDLKLTRDPATVSGSIRIGSDPPFNVEASADIASLPDAPLAWRTQAGVHGPLERLAADAKLQARGMSADATATVLPFAAWPVPALDATTSGLDVSRLVEGAPSTALDARVHVETSGLAQPARVSADITNAAPGRADAARVPVRRVVVEASARPDDPSRIEASSLSIEFGDEQGAAGRYDGKVGLDGKRLSLDGRFEALRPERLHGLASPMTIGGPVVGVLDDIGTANRFDVQATLDGVVPPSVIPATTSRRSKRNGAAGAGPIAVQLEVDVAGTPEDIEVRKAVARSNGASATLSGRLQRGDGSTFSVKARAKLDRFDPRPFWRGGDGSPLQRGPHRLNATADADLRLRPPSRPDIDSWLNAIDGRAELELADSVVAGLAAAADLKIDAKRGRVQARGSIEAAGNKARVEGSASPGGQADRWQLQLDAPQLAALSPLLPLADADPAAARGKPSPAIAGALQGSARVDGRWPQIASDGTATVRGFAFSGIAISTADAKWKVGGTSVDAPLDVQIDMSQATVGAADNGASQRIASAGLRLDGTLASHRFTLRATSPLRPPEWVDRLAAVQTGQSTLAVVRGSGAANDRQWRATFDEIRVGGFRRAATVGSPGAPRPADDPATSALPPWLSMRELKLALEFDPATKQPTAVEVEPGRAELVGAQLKWQRIAWRAPTQPGQQPQIDVVANLEPMAVAPWLARVQPDFGWSGDLTVGARIDVHSAPTFNADIVVERAAGDLSVVDPTLPKTAPGRAPSQQLGLTDLRIALAAHDGTWYFTQALAGTTMGVAAGAITLRVSPQTVVPPADTPLQGVLEAQVADLGVWGTWLPAGWRLGGTLRTGASIGGRLNAPEYTGRMTGRALSVRNLLEGVNVRDGDLDLSLQGETARVERFIVKAGDGSATLDGDVRFGAQPVLQLNLSAERFEVLGRVDRRIVASGKASIRFAERALRLDGRVKVDEGMIDVSQGDAPSLGDDVVVHRTGEPTDAAVESQNGTSSDIRMDLRVDLGESLRVRGRGIDTRLAGNLAITAPRGKLAVNGDVRTVEGKYAAYGQKLDIDRGVIAFTGPVENPRLDILAIRPKLDVKVGVAVTGNAQSPRVRLTSEPEMSDTDKLSWLILGRAPDGLGRTDAALLQRAALGALSGEEPSKTDQLIGALGLDELSVSQTEGTTRDTVVTLGKQLSQRWYVGYERGLSATAGSWQLIYRVAQRFTLRGQSGLDNSIDAIWTWRWD